MTKGFRTLWWVGTVLVILALAMVAYAIGTLFEHPGPSLATTDISFTQLLADVGAGKVCSVTVAGPEIDAMYRDDRRFRTFAPNDPSFLARLRANGVAVTTPAAR